MARKAQGKKATAVPRRTKTPTAAVVSAAVEADFPPGLSGRLSGLMDQIGGLREQAVAQIRELEHALAAAKQELATIDGLMGRKTAAPAARKVALPGPGKRMPRGYWRAQVLKALDGKPDGLNKSELLAALDAKGDKTQEASVSNTLMALKKAAEITHEGGRYGKNR